MPPMYESDFFTVISTLAKLSIRYPSASYPHMPPTAALFPFIFILPEYEHQGYATEAVRAACRWAFEQPGVTAVEAETAPDHAASQAVLHRVGFVPTGTVGKEGPRFILRQKP